ncbi:MAG: hypothetical protein AABY22_33990, partial [Nanoarchaeota archaeon]
MAEETATFPSNFRNIPKNSNRHKYFYWLIFILIGITFSFLNLNFEPFNLSHKEAQSQTADITTGLVSHWKFDEG